MFSPESIKNVSSVTVPFSPSRDLGRINDQLLVPALRLLRKSSTRLHLHFPFFLQVSSTDNSPAIISKADWEERLERHHLSDCFVQQIACNF